MYGSNPDFDEDDQKEVRELRIAIKTYDIKTICKFLPSISRVFTDEVFRQLVMLVFMKDPKEGEKIIEAYFAFRRELAGKKNPPSHKASEGKGGER